MFVALVLAAQINIVAGFIILIHFHFHLFHDLALLSMKIPCSFNVSAHTQGLTRFPSLSCVLRTLSDLGKWAVGQDAVYFGGLVFNSTYRRCDTPYLSPVS